jgi:C4-dicarboxylate transporter, DctM subunit
MSVFVLFAVLFAALLLGVPVAMSLGLASAVTLILFTDQSLLSLAQKFFHTMHIYPLLAVPFFILAGAFMTSGGMAQRLIDFANAIVGHYRGGLAMASVLGCMLFAAVSGSSPATVAAVGSVTTGGMARAGYPKAFGAGVIASAGTLGILIPPSIVMVVYGAATETSIGKLFMAGIVPGILLTLVMLVAIHIAARRHGYPAQKKLSFRELLLRSRHAIWGLSLIVLILGGIYGGIFTPTEAAAVSAVYACFVAVHIHKDISWKDVPRVIRDAAKTSTMLMFIIANASLFAFVLTLLHVPQNAAETIAAWGLSPWVFLLLVNVLLLVAGNFMEPSSVILVLAPVIFPIAVNLGIDPVHLGIVMVINMEIGMITPPVGLNLFVTSSVTGLTIEEVVKSTLPWLAVLLSVLLVITYVPAIALALPNVLYQ